MYKDVLEKISGIGLYGAVSIGIFFVFFTGMLVWALTMKKSHVHAMENLPLDGAERPQAGKTNLKA